MRAKGLSIEEAEMAAFEENAHDAARMLGNFLFVRHDDDGVASAMQLIEQREDVPPGRRPVDAARHRDLGAGL